MKKILLFSRDPGGANAIISLVDKLKQSYEVILYGKDSAIHKYEENHLQYIDLSTEIENISLGNLEDFVDRIKPDLIITGTSADDMTEKYLWKVCEKKGIISFAILDQWINYGIRFSKYSVSEIDLYQKIRNMN